MKERKDVNMTVRVTPTELEEIREAASAKGIPYSEFVLRAIRAFMGKAEELPTREEFQALIDRLNKLEHKVYSSSDKVA
ncbi:plasmid mobilization protein [Scytonema sp. PCC 10023]|uniref:plasmid mobilization protein n=1 Tax=Scytonema sp. PCC 10023 TaxID=1680591 RepID=UPI0039C5ACE0